MKFLERKARPKLLGPELSCPVCWHRSGFWPCDFGPDAHLRCPHPLGCRRSSSLSVAHFSSSPSGPILRTSPGSAALLGDRHLQGPLGSLVGTENPTSVLPPGVHCPGPPHLHVGVPQPPGEQLRLPSWMPVPGGAHWSPQLVSGPPRGLCLWRHLALSWRPLATWAPTVPNKLGQKGLFAPAAASTQSPRALAGEAPGQHCPLRTSAPTQEAAPPPVGTRASWGD